MRLFSRLFSISLEGKNLIDKAANFIKPLEGFSPTPYADYKQWSWGYGTSAGPITGAKPTGTISQADAERALRSHIEGDLRLLTPLIKKDLNDFQMVALLSFNYNLGYGNTKKIIERINEGMDATGIAYWINQYVMAGDPPKRLQALVDRRAKEAKLYQQTA